MGNMIIDLQLASENTEGLPSEEQILQWATAAVQPESDNVEMTVRIVGRFGDLSPGSRTRSYRARKAFNGTLGAYDCAW